MSSFDPFEQNVTMTAKDGSPLIIPLPSLDEYIQKGVTACISYGSQLGASIVIFVLLLLLTGAKKRRTVVFCLNITTLLLNIIRMVCLVLFYTGAFFETYAVFSGDYSRVKRGDYASSVISQVMNALVEVLMESSLIVQAMAVVTTAPALQKTIVLVVSVIVATVVMGFRVGQMVVNSILIVWAKSSGPYIWLQEADAILITVSTCYFSTIFCGKLGYMIYKRKQLGVHQFGPMQVIFTMSFQTMILPAIFSILQFSNVPLHEINANILTFVVISLPVTSIWASTALPGQSKAQGIESGPPLWEELTTSNSATRFDNSGSNPFQPHLASMNATTPVDAVDLLYREPEESGKSATVGTGEV